MSGVPSGSSAEQGDKHDSRVLFVADEEMDSKEGSTCVEFLKDVSSASADDFSFAVRLRREEG